MDNGSSYCGSGAIATAQWEEASSCEEYGGRLVCGEGGWFGRVGGLPSAKAQLGEEVGLREREREII